MEDFDKTMPPAADAGSDDVTMPGKRDRKPDERFAVGDLIMDRYKVLAELGQGGMGVVYKCFDEDAGVEIALKALPPELSHNTLEMEDIKENFQLVHNLHHPNIASSNNLEKDRSNGNYYLIMECCTGEDLRRWLKRKRKEGKLKLEDVLPIIQQVAEALDYAHKQKIMHRDIKPGNIMINNAGEIKVLDFGLAAQIHTSMTRVSMAYHGTSGTGPYMAPEQWRGKAQGAAADQYALAVMAYEMLAGRLPFENADAAVLKQAVLDEFPDEIANIPKSAQEALNRAMSKDSAERFASCSDFAAALSGKKIKSAKKKSKGGFAKWAAAVLVLALLCAGGTYYFVNQPASVKPAPVKPESVKPESKPVPVKPDKSEREITALVQTTYRLQARVLNKKRDIESARYDRGQSFGKYLDTLRETFDAGELAMKNNDVTSAHASFQAADQAADWLITNAPLRLDVQKLQAETARQKAEADRFNASRLAYAAYKESSARVAQAQNAYDSGNFTAASAALKEALTGYQKAGREARALTLKELLDSAERAKRSRQWKKVHDQAVAVLRIDSASKEAQALKTEAENNLIPTLKIYAYVDGKSVSATVKSLKTMPDKSSRPWKLKKGAEYEFEITYKSGEDEYIGRIPAFVCTANGPHHKKVTLKKVGGDNGTVTLPNGIKLEMVKVEPGSFTMSARDGSNDGDEVSHKKTLTQAFYIGKYEVTQEQWRTIMGTTVKEQRNKANNAWSLRGEGGRYPVYYVNWHEAMAFCEKMNQYAPKGWRFTLPTETQWEFAARGGNKSRGHKYSGGNDLDAVSWYEENSGKATHEVGQKRANELGLYDMSGNVYEWCLDNYKIKHKNTRSEFPRPSRSYRIVRGGSCSSLARSCLLARRSYFLSGNRASHLGFRVALVKRQSPPKTVSVPPRPPKRMFTGMIPLANGVKLEMVKVEPGTFTMSARDEKISIKFEVPHSKTLTRTFYIGKYEVTNAQWCAVMGVSTPPSFFKKTGAQYPVESITWYEAMAFCKKMNQYAPKGWKFTLPTETQWEFAARGGNKSRGYKYSGGNDLDAVGWYRENSGKKTHKVGQKRANELGLYDMSGNVAEWCLDNWEDKSNNTRAEFTRPYRDTDSSSRVSRGSSWSGNARLCRSACRYKWKPENRRISFGFRLALVPVQ